VLVASAARADDVANAPAKEAATAFARGQALFNNGEYANAIAAFERAYSLKAHHAVQCSIATCYEQMNRFVEAAEHFRRCLAEGARDTAKAESVRGSLAAVEAKINYVEVKSPGAGGTVYVDGIAQGPAPRRVPLDPGRHLIEVRRAGALSVNITLRLVSGEERTLTLVPTELGAAQPQAEPRPVATPVVHERGRRRLAPGWFWTSVALTVGLGAAAGVMGGMTYSSATDYDRAPTKEGYDTFASRRLVTNVLAGLALAAAGTGTALFFFTDFSGRRHQEGLSAGIGVGGAF